MSVPNLQTLIPSLIPLIPHAKYTIVSSDTDNPKNTFTEFVVGGDGSEIYRENFISTCNGPITAMKQRVTNKIEKIAKAINYNGTLGSNPVRLSVIPSDSAENTSFTIEITFKITKMETIGNFPGLSTNVVKVGEIVESMCIAVTPGWSSPSIPNELVDIPGEIHLKL